MRYVYLLLLSIISSALLAQESTNTIEIRTHFHSFVGKPSWLVTIRDVDKNKSYPHLFDITSGDNTWVLPTHGYNYLITVSNMRASTYDSINNYYRQYQIKNFCHLESRGRIIRGKSMLITIDGELSKNSNGYRCHIQQW
jgi:hypothetical protein